MTKTEIINETICYLLVVVFAFGWIDVLWMFGVENSKQYTWWALIQYFGN